MDEAETNPYLPSQAEAPPVQPLAANSLKDPRALALWACWLLAAGTLMELLLHAVEMFAPLDDLNDAESPVLWGYVLCALLMLLFGITAMVIYLCWKYRAAKNATLIDPSMMPVGPGMAVGSYFIPIVGFFIPCQAMSGICRASFGGTWRVGVWWALYLASWLFGIREISDDSEVITRPDEFGHLTVAIDLAFAIVAIGLVMRITRAQSALARATPPPMPG